MRDLTRITLSYLPFQNRIVARLRRRARSFHSLDLAELPPHNRRVIDTVFFDAGNTLVYVNYAYLARLLNGRVTLSKLQRADDLGRYELDVPEFIARSTDAKRWGAYFRAILHRCGVRDPQQIRTTLTRLKRYHESRNLWDYVPNSVELILAKLRRTYRLAVISNADGSCAYLLKRLGLASSFETIVDSHAEGIEKPDPRLFVIALDRMKAKPQHSVFVGDFYHIDIVGAQSAGIRGVLLDPTGLQHHRRCLRIRSLEELPLLLKRM